MPAASIAGRFISKLSSMMLPTRVIRTAGTPSAIRLASASGDGVHSTSATASVATRLISSGMARSRERSPASRWTVLMPSFTPVSAQARVELTSPTTTSQSGRWAAATSP